MAQQTAVQHLIKWLEVGWKDEDVESIIKKCNQLLEMEKKHIIDAFDMGCQDKDRIGIEYYNENYESNT